MEEWNELVVNEFFDSTDEGTWGGWGAKQNALNIENTINELEGQDEIERSDSDEESEPVHERQFSFFSASSAF